MYGYLEGLIHVADVAGDVVEFAELEGKFFSLFFSLYE
jgi:hypothetical protein